MSESSLQTAELHLLVNRIKLGDGPARNEFVRCVASRIERLAHNMLRQFSNVRRWEETGDVFQQVLMNVLKSIESGANEPKSVREFYAYVATCIRNTLLDLARHYRGVRAPELHAVNETQSSPKQNPIDNATATGDETLQRWCAFHEAVERLPLMEREVVGLKFYHGWTNQAIGEVFGVSEKMVRKHWQSACMKLNDLLGGELPVL